MYASRHAIFVFDALTGPRFESDFGSALEAEKAAENLASQRISCLVVGPEQPIQQWHAVSQIEFLASTFSVTSAAGTRNILDEELAFLAILDFENESRGGRMALLTLTDGAQFELSSQSLPRAFIDDVSDRCARNNTPIRHRRMNPPLFQLDRFSGDGRQLTLALVNALDTQAANLSGPLVKKSPSEVSALHTPPWLGWLWYLSPLLALPIALLDLTAFTIAPSWETATHALVLILWGSTRFLWAQWMGKNGMKSVPFWPLNRTENGRSPKAQELIFDAVLIALGILFRHSDGWPAHLIFGTAFFGAFTLLAGAYTVWSMPSLTPGNSNEKRD